MQEKQDALQVLEMDDYQALDAYSRSDLMLVKKSPYHLRAKREGIYPPVDKESPSMIIGELLHCLVLEPEEMETRYYGVPAIDRRTKEGKAVYAQAMIDAAGRKLISEQHFNKATLMFKNVLEHEVAAKALKGCLIERSLVWHDEETGLTFKCRPDAYNPVNGMVNDLKTTKDASYRSMQQSSVRYGYFLQAAMIREALRFHGLPFSKFLLLCVENSEPYASAALIVDESAIDSGLNEFNYLKRKLATCIYENKYEHHQLKTLLYPSWAENDYIED